MRIGRLSLPTFAAACALAMAGCGSSEISQASQARDVFENIAARNSSVSRIGVLHTSPVDAVPQARYVVDGKRPISVADAYVRGDLVSVEPGRSFRWTEDADRETRHELEFNAEDAQVSTVHLALKIERSIVDPNEPESVHRRLAPGSTVTLGLALDAPVEVEAMRGKFEGQSFAALLYASSPVFDYDSSLWAILEDGAFLGRVNDDRTVTFPALGRTGEGTDENDRFTFSFDELEGERNEPIRASYDGRRYTRVGSSANPEPNPPSSDPSQPPSPDEGDVPARLSTAVPEP